MTGYSLAEEIVVSIIAVLAFGSLAAPLAGRKWGRAFTLASLGYTLIATIIMLGLDRHGTLFKGVMLFDSFSLLLLLSLVAATLLVGIGLIDVSRDLKAVEGLYAVIAIMVLGIYTLAFSSNVIAAYASWILAAAASYIIVAMKKDWVSAEAATKYALMGGIASTLIVMGIGYLYVTSHSVSIIGAKSIYYDPLVMVVAITVLLTSIGYKMGVVPFQGWLPDVYGNARPALIAIIAPAAKVLAVLLLIRLIATMLEEVGEQALTIYATLALILAVATMTYGNLAGVAASRKDPQLVLAYSSIAQAGYLLAGLAALAGLPGMSREYAIYGLVLHVAGYVFSKASVFLGLDTSIASNYTKQIKGLVFRDPYAASGLALGLMSLMGMPPFLGFWGKLYIVLSIAAYSPLIAVIMAINFAIAAFYYARLIYPLFVRAEERGNEKRSDSRSIAVFATGLLSLLLGFMPWIATMATIAGLPLH